MITLNNLKSINKEDYEDNRSYQLALLHNTKVMKKLLQESSDKKTVLNKQLVVSSIKDKLKELSEHPYFDTTALFNEYEELLDSTAFKEDIQALLAQYFDFLKTDELTNSAYQKVKRNTTTLRKLRQEMIVLKVVKALYEQNTMLEHELLTSEVENTAMQEELQEKTRQLNEIYAGYSAEDEKLAIVWKYKKHKKDGLTDAEIVKILNTTKPSLYKLLKEYEAI